MLVEDLDHELVDAEVLGLHEQALAQVASRHADRIEALDHLQHFLGVLGVELGLARPASARLIGGPGLRGEVALVVEVADHELGEALLVVDEVAHPDLPARGGRRGPRSWSASPRSWAARRSRREPRAAAPAWRGSRGTAPSRSRRPSSRCARASRVARSVVARCAASRRSSRGSPSARRSPHGCRSASISRVSSSTGFSSSSSRTISTSSMRDICSSLIACCSCGVITSCWESLSCCLSSKNLDGFPKAGRRAPHPEGG